MLKSPKELKNIIKVLKKLFYYGIINTRYCNAKLLNEVTAMSLFANNSSNSGNKTYDSEYGYLYTFVDLLEKIIKMILGLFGSLGSSGDTDNAEGENEGEVVTP